MNYPCLADFRQAYIICPMAKLTAARSEPAQIIGYAAELLQQLSIAEFADHRITAAAEGNCADAAGGPGHDFRAPHGR
jgi:hypothetical protein